MKLIGL
jgi:hypothetical protein